MTARDFQRSKLYGWERAELKTGRLLEPKDTTPLGEAGAQRLVSETWRDFCPELGQPPTVRVMGNRGRGTSFARRILLSSSYTATQESWYVLHELAHTIQTRRPNTWKMASHGPEFCLLYAELLDRYTSAWKPKVVGSMRGAGLKVEKKS